MTMTDRSAPFEHRVGPTGLVTVRLANWDVEVVGVDGETVRVGLDGGGSLPNELELERGPDSVTIRQPNRLGFGLVSSRRPSETRLTIEVPAGATTSVQTASGDLQVRDVRGPLNARTASGDVRLLEVAGDIQVETVSGDVVIDLAAPSRLALKTVSGDALVEGSRADRFMYTSTSGDLRITSELGEGPHAIATVSGDAIVATRNGIRVSAQTVAGDLSTDLPHTSEGRPGRRSIVVGEGSTVLQFRSTSGDLRVVRANGTGHDGVPLPPTPPAPPAAPAPVASASAADAGGPDADAGSEPDADAGSQPDADAAEAARLDILRALERGEIDIDEATARLAALDGPTDG
jgi:hypothetical protein